MAKVVLKRGRANPLWHGHPWVYSGAIEREEGGYQPGDVVEVCDADGRRIGRGFANPRSQIRVRMVGWRDEQVDDALIARRIEEAIALRTKLGLPSEETTAYRLINSEGDALPGLVVDVYGDVCAVQFTALGAKRVEGAIYEALAALMKPRAIVEVSAGGFAQLEGFGSATRVVRGDEVETVRCRENGVELEVEPLRGQKTGMFLDQRENRRRLGALAKGARVLDVYTYAGGFALNALRSGATSATCVDSSARALERVRSHAELNHFSNVETVEADAFRFLETTRPKGWDLVVVDPPKFARARKDLDAALKGYERLNTLAMTACAPGALLATSSCSQLVDGESFERVIAAAARDAGRRVQVLESSSQGPDHPVPPAFPEGRYLKFLLCRVV
ncbi:MAG TPA: class I SAM-dependent rRNA methyltransferase [Polyangia bacterium]|jgi:23S rRNA (cytosine1962-C5)-methyltransferase